MTLLRVEMPNFVAGAVVNNGKIIESAPILRRFLNQPTENLLRWAQSRRGSVQVIDNWDAVPALMKEQLQCPGG